MHLIVCVDDRDGMLFNRRRVSSDKALTQYLLTLTQDHNLWMNAYSAKLFAGCEDRILVAENCLTQAGRGEYCFAEGGDLLSCGASLESVILCSWNRKYPADTYFPRQLLANATLVWEEEIPGNSHEAITLRRYEL